MMKDGINTIGDVLRAVGADFEEATLKINGQPITVAWDSVHVSWFETLLVYGARRFPNDKNAGETDGNAKHAAVAKLVASMAHEMPATVRGSGGKASDPVAEYALRSAKADLLVAFKKLTGNVKIADLVNHAKVKPFFKSTKVGDVWNDEAVGAWIIKQAAKGKRDYLAEATKAVSGEIDLEV